MDQSTNNNDTKAFEECKAFTCLNCGELMFEKEMAKHVCENMEDRESEAKVNNGRLYVKRKSRCFHISSELPPKQFRINPAADRNNIDICENNVDINSRDQSAACRTPNQDLVEVNQDKSLCLSHIVNENLRFLNDYNQLPNLNFLASLTYNEIPFSFQCKGDFDNPENCYYQRKDFYVRQCYEDVFHAINNVFEKKIDSLPFMITGRPGIGKSILGYYLISRFRIKKLIIYIYSGAKQSKPSHVTGDIKFYLIDKDRAFLIKDYKIFHEIVLKFINDDLLYIFDNCHPQLVYYKPFYHVYITSDDQSKILESDRYTFFFIYGLTYEELEPMLQYYNNYDGVDLILKSKEETSNNLHPGNFVGGSLEDKSKVNNNIGLPNEAKAENEVASNNNKYPCYPLTNCYGKLYHYYGGCVRHILREYLEMASRYVKSLQKPATITQKPPEFYQYLVDNEFTYWKSQYTHRIETVLKSCGKVPMERLMLSDKSDIVLHTNSLVSLIERHDGPTAERPGRFLSKKIEQYVYNYCLLVKNRDYYNTLYDHFMSSPLDGRKGDAYEKLVFYILKMLLILGDDIKFRFISSVYQDHLTINRHELAFLLFTGNISYEQYENKIGCSFFNGDFQTIKDDHLYRCTRDYPTLDCFTSKCGIQITISKKHEYNMKTLSQFNFSDLIFITYGTKFVPSKKGAAKGRKQRGRNTKGGDNSRPEHRRNDISTQTDNADNNNESGNDNNNESGNDNNNSQNQNPQDLLSDQLDFVGESACGSVDPIDEAGYDDAQELNRISNETNLRIHQLVIDQALLDSLIND